MPTTNQETAEENFRLTKNRVHLPGIGVPATAEKVRPEEVTKAHWKINTGKSFITLKKITTKSSLGTAL